MSYLYGSNAIAIFREEQASGTNAGGFTAGSYVTRVLNTTVVNGISGASLASNQITLPAGTYEVTAYVPAQEVNSHKALLYNVTDAANTTIGTTTYCGNAYGASSYSVINARFTIAASKVFEIRHRCSTTRTVYGLGYATTFGDNEVYTTISIRKL